MTETPRGIVTEVELVSNIQKKSEGDIRSGYKTRISHHTDTIQRAILAHIPTNLNSFHRFTDSGLPVVDPNDPHLAQNLVETIRPQLKSCAAIRELNKLISDGLLVRVPAQIKIMNRHNTAYSYNRAYVYLDSRCDMPTWWPRHLSEPGDLKHISYSSYKNRDISLASDHVDTISESVRRLLPNAPTPDLEVRSNTPGTVDYFLEKVSMEPTRHNKLLIRSTLRRMCSTNEVNKVNRKCVSSYGNTISVYFRA